MKLQDVCIAVFGNTVGKDVATFADGFEFVVVYPDPVEYSDLDKIQRRAGDVTISADGHDVRIRVHAARDDALVAANDAQRLAQLPRKFIVANPEDVTPLVKKIGDAVVRELPLDKYTFTLSQRDGGFELFAPLARHARVSVADLLKVNTKLEEHDGALSIVAKDDRLCLCLSAKTHKRKRVAAEITPKEARVVKR